MTEMTIQDLMQAMPAAFLPEKAAGLNAVVQYHLTGAEAGDWVITIKDAKCSVQPGTAPHPTLTLTADSQVYKNLLSGKLNGMTAFMQGKIQLAGDLNLAMKLTSLFKA